MFSRLDVPAIYLDDNPAEDHEKDRISIRKLNRYPLNLSRLGCFVILCFGMLTDVWVPRDMILE